jgi:hypothetical protein
MFLIIFAIAFIFLFLLVNLHGMALLVFLAAVFASIVANSEDSY